MYYNTNLIKFEAYIPTAQWQDSYQFSLLQIQ